MTSEETAYSERSDRVETKLKLLLSAREAGDYRQAIALADSLAAGLQAEWHLRRNAHLEAPQLGLTGWRPVSELPETLSRWAHGWTMYQTVTLTEAADLDRRAEPVDVTLAADAGQVASLQREVRVARVDERAGGVTEVPSQVYDERRIRATDDDGSPSAGTGASSTERSTISGTRSAKASQASATWSAERGTRQAHLVWLADVPANGRTTYLILAGNPAAELPDYPTNLRVKGEGFGLDIENEHFVASLSRQMGQLERLTYKRAHGLELFAGGEGHGEPPHIDWAHDYLASGNFQKFRVTNWETCQRYEVVRGPLCVKIRRWGFPHSPLHPVFTASRMLVDVTYTFFAGAPYFLKHGTMQAIQDFSLNYLRDDEWVFSGYSFDEILWMDETGRVHEGAVPPDHAGRMWGVGFYNRTSQDAFFSVRLEHRLQGPSAGGARSAGAGDRRPVLHHADAPMLSYVPHGHVWSRWALRGDPRLRAGDTLFQRNAYLVEPYRTGEGAAQLEAWRHRFLQPLRVDAGAERSISTRTLGAPRAMRPASLARVGEDLPARTQKQAIWTALRQVRDEMFYTVDANVVDMGYIYDVRLRGETVHVLMTMPHRGRPKYMFLGQHVRARLESVAGIRSVVVELTWEPPWTPDRLTDAGRKTMGLHGSLELGPAPSADE